MKKVTIYDVADRAGVAFKTVSRVLNNDPTVQPSYRERILKAVKELNYQPNLSARQLAGQRSYTIGLVYDASDTTTYNSRLQNGALFASAKAGFNLSPCPVSGHASEEVKTAINNLVMTNRVDALILTSPIGETPGIESTVEELDTACVRISSDLAGSRAFITIGIDEVTASRDLTNHLLELGHERIGFIKGHKDHISSKARYAGYREALHQQGLSFDRKLVKAGQYTFQSGERAAARLMSLDEPPTAIFASDDDTAVGAMHYLHDEQLKIPLDISVVGFDDSSLAQYVWPTLTTVRQPVSEYGKLAVELLVEKINRKPTPEDGEKPTSMKLLHEIIIRNSSGPAPKMSK